MNLKFHIGGEKIKGSKKLTPKMAKKAIKIAEEMQRINESIISEQFTYSPEEIKKIRNEIVQIILDSKATFFIANGEKPKIPVDEALYELKAEICTNVERYFLKILK